VWRLTFDPSGSEAPMIGATPNNFMPKGRMKKPASGYQLTIKPRVKSDKEYSKGSALSNISKTLIANQYLPGKFL
jgi:hypothetical protein